jgi:hypothetical protein
VDSRRHTFAGILSGSFDRLKLSADRLGAEV